MGGPSIPKQDHWGDVIAVVAIFQARNARVAVRQLVSAEARSFVLECFGHLWTVNMTEYTWVFPKIMVPPNHSVFHYKPSHGPPFWGTPIFGNTHLYVRWRFCRHPLQPICQMEWSFWRGMRLAYWQAGQQDTQTSSTLEEILQLLCFPISGNWIILICLDDLVLSTQY